MSIKFIFCLTALKPLSSEILDVKSNQTYRNLIINYFRGLFYSYPGYPTQGGRWGYLNVGKVRWDRLGSPKNRFQISNFKHLNALYLNNHPNQLPSYMFTQHKPFHNNHKSNAFLPIIIMYPMQKHAAIQSFQILMFRLWWLFDILRVNTFTSININMHAGISICNALAFTVHNIIYFMLQNLWWAIIRFMLSH